MSRPDGTPLDVLQRLTDPLGLVSVPEAVKTLAAWRTAIDAGQSGFDPVAGARSYLTLLAAQGIIDLHHGEAALLSEADRALCLEDVAYRPFAALRVVS